MTGRRHAGEAGFTLVELLVAVTLLTLLMALLFGGLRLAGRAWAKVDYQTDADADFWAARVLLRRAIASAYPAFAAADLSDRTIVFDGSGDALALVAPLPAAIAAGVEARQRFFVEAEGPSHAFFMGWRLDLPSADGETSLPENRVRLLGHVSAVRFDYFGAPEPALGPQWQKSWSGYAHLPDLVRVHFERDAATGPAWPDLLVAPRTTMNTACIYDAVAIGCRRVR
ncbi:MAG TPA: prepilin-type N-terminal cleavage/methylation domain-containing protein [Stellaceae bacterium]